MELRDVINSEKSLQAVNWSDKTLAIFTIIFNCGKYAGRAEALAESDGVMTETKAALRSPPTPESSDEMDFLK